MSTCFKTEALFCATRIVAAIMMYVLVASDVRAGMMIWANSSPLRDDAGAVLTNGYVTLWRVGNDGLISHYGYGDDTQVTEIDAVLTPGDPGNFFVMVDLSTNVQISEGTMVYTRVFDGTNIATSSAYAEVGLPPRKVQIQSGEAPEPAWIYDVEGMRADGKSWPPLTPGSFLEFSQTNYDFGSLELGVTVTQHLTVSAWYYSAVQFSNSMTTPPWHTLSSASGVIQAPGSMTVVVECRPLVTGVIEQIAGLDYSSIYGTRINVPVKLRCTGIVTDTDVDGVSDVWELSHFGSLTNSAGANTDTDADGASDSSEWIAGTNPDDASSVLSAGIAVATDETFEIDWPSVATATYSVFTGTNLIQGITGEVAAAIVATPPVNTVVLPIAPGPQQYFRISIDR